MMLPSFDPGTQNICLGTKEMKIAPNQIKAGQNRADKVLQHGQVSTAGTATGLS